MGLRLGRRASQAVRAVARPAELQAPDSSACAAPWHPSFGLMKKHAEELASILREAGVADMPIGVDIIEPPMMFELREGRPQCRRRPAGDAGSARDQVARRDRAA